MRLVLNAGAAAARTMPSGRQTDASKPHVRRQARREAAAAESAAQLEAFVVEAREATILPLSSQEDIEYAQSLGRREGDRGGHLIRWAGSGEGDDVWLDSHDVLHLLPSLPSLLTRSPSPSSSTGWTDLPSDAEDTFFLDEAEQEEYERAKKRRKFDDLRQDRMRQLEAREAAERIESDSNSKRDDPHAWQGDDEEPPEDIRQLMAHTLKALVASPNPQVLELRILTNHAGDRRFEFLKGRYRNHWMRMKGEKAAPSTVGLLGGGYDSEEEGDPSPPASPPPLPPEPDDLKAARRQKAQEWLKRRRE